MTCSRCIGPAALAFGLLVTACSGVPGEPMAGEPGAGGQISPIAAATYHGGYTGNDNGSVVLELGATGAAQITATSTFWRTSFAGAGQVGASGTLSGGGSGGGIAIMAGSGSSGGSGKGGGVNFALGGVVFTVSGSVNGTTASGTWSTSNGGKGTWSARQ